MSSKDASLRAANRYLREADQAKRKLAEKEFEATWYGFAFGVFGSCIVAAVVQLWLWAT